MKKKTRLGVLKRKDKAVPDVLTPAVAQAVLTDAVLEAAADLAAASATREFVPSGSEESLFAGLAPARLEQALDLVRVPLLGPTRARALADIGILSLADLHAAPLAQIGGVKGVGMRNAERIKEWLATQQFADPGKPPPPPAIDVPLVGSADPTLALENAAIFDGLGEIDALITLLHGAMGDGGISKKLERQFERVSSVASELAEGPDTLSAKQLPQAVKLLYRVIGELQGAVDRKRLSEKRQEALADELRKLRKELQKVIGD